MTRQPIRCRLAPSVLHIQNTCPRPMNVEYLTAVEMRLAKSEVSCHLPVSGLTIFRNHKVACEPKPGSCLDCLARIAFHHPSGWFEFNVKENTSLKRSCQRSPGARRSKMEEEHTAPRPNSASCNVFSVDMPLYLNTYPFTCPGLISALNVYAFAKQ